MNKPEESMHLRAVFRMADDAGKLKLVSRLRDIAIERLAPVKAKVPRAMSDRMLEIYRAEGISVEWNLTTTDAFELYFQAQNAGLSASEFAACALLYECSDAIDKGAVTDDAQQRILDSFAGLDADDIAIGGRRRSQSADWGRRGADARRKYSESEKQEWRRLAQTEFAGIASKLDKARRIAKRTGLPDEAVETIRRAIKNQT